MTGPARTVPVRVCPARRPGPCDRGCTARVDEFAFTCRIRAEEAPR